MLLEILREFVLSVLLVITTFVGEPSTVLHPHEFQSEIAVVDRLIEHYNSYGMDSFHFEMLYHNDAGYHSVYRRDDGISAEFRFNEKEQLMEFKVFAYNDEGRKLGREGEDIASMLAYHVFEYSMDKKNHYNLMQLFSGWDQDMSIRMVDSRLGLLQIKQEKITSMITMTLPSARSELLEKGE